MTTNDFLAANFRDIHSYEDFFKSDRRDFLKRVGGGIFIFMAVNDALLGQEEAPRPRGGGRGGLPSDFNAFLRIGEDGRVTCYTGKIEMGQGPITSLPQNGGRGTGRAARHGGHRDGRHRPMPVGHGHVRLDDHAHVWSGAAVGGSGSQRRFARTRRGRAESAASATRRQGRRHFRFAGCEK